MFVVVNTAYLYFMDIYLMSIHEVYGFEIMEGLGN